MIFRPELVKLILQGKKTQTRRPSGRYQAGKSYAVQPGRGRAAVCRITVSAVRDERLGDLSLKDAKREGFVTTEAFFDYWRSLYGTVDPDMQVSVISFELGDRTDTPRLLAARTGPPHGDYVAESYLAMRDEGEALSAADLELYGKLAHARDQARSNDPLRRERDAIARALEAMREQVGPSSDVRDSVVRLERELRVLNRKLAA